MKSKEIIKFGAFLAALAIFTYIVFHLSVGWFTIVMSAMVGITFLLIMLSPDEKDNSGKNS